MATKCFFVERIGTKTKGPGEAPIFLDAVAGKEYVGESALPPGALFFRHFMVCEHEPKCEEHLFAVLPTGQHWDIDSRASNCTEPEDKEHHCWVRYGDPRHPETMNVNKAGKTCAAGAGSIEVSGSHGFLTNGEFTDGC